jgi:hypothetical protein
VYGICEAVMVLDQSTAGDRGELSPVSRLGLPVFGVGGGQFELIW